MTSVRKKPALAAAIASLTLVGCRSSNDRGSGMMGSGSVYHYSKLACTAPADLPGRTVNVRLGDMGMTQMMGGTAPLGAHMMLRAVPGTVAAGRVSLVATNIGWRTHELVILPLAAGNRPAGGSPDQTAKSMRQEAWLKRPPDAALVQATAFRRVLSVGPP